MKKTIFALSMVSLLFAACKKNDKEAPDITPTIQNVAGSYKLAKITVKVGSNPEQDVTSSYQETCERDDINKFNTDLTYNYIDAGTVCSPDGSYDGT